MVSTQFISSIDFKNDVDFTSSSNFSTLLFLENRTIEKEDIITTIRPTIKK